MTADRHWPMWSAVTPCHGYAHRSLRIARAPVLDLAAASWAIPGMIVMVAGLFIDRKNGIRCDLQARDMALDNQARDMALDNIVSH